MAIVRSPSDDFTLDSLNAAPLGITFANNKLWVVDLVTDSVFAYNLDGTRASSDDFDLDSLNRQTRGITFANNRFWVVDSTANKVYAHKLNGTRASSDDFRLNRGNAAPQGITFVNNKLWVVDSSADKVFVYNLDGTRSASDEFSLDRGNGSAPGITFANNRFWVVDLTDSVFAYNLDGTRASSDDFDLDSLNTGVQGITFANNKLWVADSETDSVFAYKFGAFFLYNINEQITVTDSVSMIQQRVRTLTDFIRNNIITNLLTKLSKIHTISYSVMNNSTVLLKILNYLRVPRLGGGARGNRIRLRSEILSKRLEITKRFSSPVPPLSGILSKGQSIIHTVTETIPRFSDVISYLKQLSHTISYRISVISLLLFNDKKIRIIAETLPSPNAILQRSTEFFQTITDRTLRGGSVTTILKSLSAKSRIITGVITKPIESLLFNDEKIRSVSDSLLLPNAILQRSDQIVTRVINTMSIFSTLLHEASRTIIRSINENTLSNRIQSVLHRSTSITRYNQQIIITMRDNVSKFTSLGLYEIAPDVIPIIQFTIQRINVVVNTLQLQIIRLFDNVTDKPDDNAPLFLVRNKIRRIFDV